MDWLNSQMLVQRGIGVQQVDHVKTSESRWQPVVAGELLLALSTWRQVTHFSAPDDWVFVSPI